MGLNYQAAVTIDAKFVGESEVNKANASLSNLDKTTQAISGGFKSAANAFKGFLAAYVIKEAAERTIGFAKGIIDLGDSMDELKQKTGISVNTLLSFKEAAAQSGVDLGSLEGALKKFAVTSTKAAAGSKETIEAFNAIGISAKDLKNLKPDELLLKVADQFGKYADGSEKAAVAAALFGKSAGPDLIPTLNQGSEAIEKLGLKMSDEFAKRAGEFNDQMQKIGTNFQQAGINGTTVLLPALEDIAAALVQISGSANDVGGPLVLVGEALRQLTAVALGSVTGVVQVLDTLYLMGQTLYDLFQGVIDQLLNLGQVASEVVHAIATGDITAIPEIMEEAFKRAGLAAAKTFGQIGTDGDAFLDRFAKRMESTGNAISKIQDRSIIFGDPDAQTPNSAAKGNKGSGKSKPSPGRIGGDDENAKKTEREVEAITKYTIAQQEAIEADKRKIESLGIYSAEQEKANIALEEHAKTEKAIVGFGDNTKKMYRDVTEEVIKQKQALVDLQEQQKKSFGVGAQQAFAEYAENAKNTAAQVKQLFGGMLKGLEDALVKFVQTGQLNFGKLAAFIEEELIRIAVRKTIALTIGAAFAGGGVMTSDGPAPLRKYASGGIANSPQTALFGEGSQPEAYVPLPDGRSIPVTMKGAGGGGTSVTVNVTVNNSGQTEKQSAQSDSQKGRDLGNLITAAVQGEIIRQQRPGGLLA